VLLWRRRRERVDDLKRFETVGDQRLLTPLEMMNIRPE
jgi:hypothetical protein